MKVVASLLLLTLMPGILAAESRGNIFNIRLSESTSLKFDFVERSLIVIPVFVNDSGPYRFLLDTGASITVVASKLARKLNLQNGRTDRMSSAGGSVIVNIHALEGLRIGDIRIRRPLVAVADFGLMKNLELDGILGADHMKSFSVSIDYSKQIVRLERT